jgi:hypothetical protein
MMKAVLVLLACAQLSAALPSHDLIGTRANLLSHFDVRVRQQQALMGQRRTASGYTSGSASSYASGGGTPPPTPPPPTAEVIQQQITFTHFNSTADYTGTVKQLYEAGYMSMLGLCTTTSCAAFKTGCSVTSQASATAFSRRASVYVRYTATVAPAFKTAANAALGSATAAIFANAVNAVKAANSTFAGVATLSASSVTIGAGQISTPSTPSPTTSGGTPSTPSPTTTTTTTSIVQVATFTHLAGPSAYTGTTKQLYEKGYGNMLGLCANNACSSYKTGCGVASQASATAFARRATVYVQFTATAHANQAAAAQTAANTFASGTAGKDAFIAAMNTVKANDAALAAVTVPTAAQITGVAAPTVTVQSDSGAASVGASWCVALGLAVLAMRQ